MNLREFKNKVFEETRQEVKNFIAEGNEVNSHAILSQDDLDQIMEEVFIENFAEEVQWDTEVSLEESFIDDHNEPQEYNEFVPMAEGYRMDIEMEVDLDQYNPSYDSLAKIRDTFFAEDYEVVIDENKNRAKVFYKRAAGKIIKRKKCGKGMRLVGNRCLPQTGTQKAKERVKGIRLKRAKKAMGRGRKKMAVLKTKITKRRVKGRNRNYAGT